MIESGGTMGEANTLAGQWKKREGGVYDQFKNARSLINAWIHVPGSKSSQKNKNKIATYAALQELAKYERENKNNPDADPMAEAHRILNTEEPPGFWAMLGEKIFGSDNETDDAGKRDRAIQIIKDKNKELIEKGQPTLPLTDANIQNIMDQL